MTLRFDTAALGLWLELGAALVVLLVFFLIGRRSAPVFHRWWTAAWALRAASIGALLAALSHPVLAFLICWQLLALGFGIALWQGTRLFGEAKPSPTALRVIAAVCAVWPLAATAFALESGLRPQATPVWASLIAQAFSTAALSLLALHAAFSVARRSGDLGPRTLAAGSGALMLLALTGGAAGLAADTERAAAAILAYSAYPFALCEFTLAIGMLLCRGEQDQRRLASFNLGLASAHRELIQTYAMLRDEAERDPLTDAFNRMAFRRFWKEAQPRVLRGCVALIDMDSLKLINDRHGHEAGDRAIRFLADAIRGLFRLEDPLFRWGGDEFLLLLPRADREDTESRLERLNPLLSRAWDGPPPPPQASWGIETFDSPRELNEALKRADRAMYEAKKKPTARSVG